MYQEYLTFRAIVIGAGIGLITALVTGILMWRHGGNSAGEIAKYTAGAFVTPAFIVLATAGWWFGDLPPRNFSIAGVADQSVTSAAVFAAGEHCLAGPADDRHHQGIRNRFERYARKYNSRNRLKIESETMGPLIEDGRQACMSIPFSIITVRPVTVRPVNPKGWA